MKENFLENLKTGKLEVMYGAKCNLGEGKLDTVPASSLSYDHRASRGPLSCSTNGPKALAGCV